MRGVLTVLWRVQKIKKKRKERGLKGERRVGPGFGAGSVWKETGRFGRGIKGGETHFSSFFLFLSLSSPS